MLVKSVEVNIGVKGDREAKASLDDINKRAEALKKAFPEYKLKIDSAAASERLKVFRAQLAEATRDRTENIKVKVDDSALSKFAKKMQGGGPGLLIGSALALAPAATTLGGVGLAAGAGLAGAFAAGAGALAAFGAVAKPVLTDAKTAATAVETAQNNYNAAIAGGTKKAVAYKAEQIAIAKAYANLSPAQITLSKQLGAMASAWDDVKAAETPVVAGSLQPWLKSVTGLMGSLAPIIAKVAPVIKDLGVQFNGLVNSAAFKGFRDFVANTGSKVVGAVGGTLIDFVKAAMILLPKFNPLILQMTGGIAGLGPAVLKWANSKKTSDDIKAFMAWFNTNGPVVAGLFRNIAGALKVMAPGLTAGGAAELQVMSAFFGMVAKLPPGLARPLFSVAGALLLLNKVGVVTAGVKLVGLGSAAAGAGTLGGPLAAAGAGIAGGLILKIREDLKSGWLGIVHDLPQWLGGVGGILNLSAQGWADTIVNHFSKPVRKLWADLGHFLAASFDQTRHDVSHVADNLGHYLAGSFTQTRRQVAGIWNDLWLNTVTRVARGFHDVAGWFDTGRHWVADRMAGIRHDTAAAWDTIWNNTVGRVRRGVGDVVSWFTGLPGKVVSALTVLGADLHYIAIWALSRLLAGAKDAVGGITSFFSSFAHGIVSVFKKIWGWFSPSSVMYEGGKSLMQGLAGGIKDHAHLAINRAKAAAAATLKFSQVAYSGTGGVSQWRGTVSQALGMEGLSQQLVDPVLYQMQTESGGNPRAINLTDINAQQGDPSRGLMQVIATTFAAYHWPGTSWDIYNPLANIAAALNYARHVYGPGLRTAYGGIGTGHGYAGGTPSASAGWAWVGERGPELVKFRGGEQVAPVRGGSGGSGGGGGNTYIINIAPTPLARPQDIGREVVGAIKSFEKGAGKGWRS